MCIPISSRADIALTNTPPIWRVTLVVIIEPTKRVPSHVVKPLQRTCGWVTSRCHLRLPNLRISCNDCWCMLKIHVGSFLTWWRQQMETFSALLAICADNSPVPGELSAQRPVTRSFDIFFDLRLNGWLNKQSWGWWFETPSRPSWRHSNGIYHFGVMTWNTYWILVRRPPVNGGFP